MFREVKPFWDHNKQRFAETNGPRIKQSELQLLNVNKPNPCRFLRIMILFILYGKNGFVFLIRKFMLQSKLLVLLFTNHPIVVGTDLLHDPSVLNVIDQAMNPLISRLPPFVAIATRKVISKFTAMISLVVPVIVLTPRNLHGIQYTQMLALLLLPLPLLITYLLMPNGWSFWCHL